MDPVPVQTPVAAQTDDSQAPAGVSAHFVNNVLAVAASYIEEDPDQARDVLAELGQFLSYGLRPAATSVTLAQELEHTRTYLRLQQARFPDRIQATVRPAGEATAASLTAGAVRGPVAQVLEQRLRALAGGAVIDVIPAATAVQVELRGPDDLVGEAITIPLIPIEETPT